MITETIFVKIARKFRPVFMNQFMEKILRILLHIFPLNQVFITLIPTSLMFKKDAYRNATINNIKLKLNLKYYNDHYTYWFSKDDILLNNFTAMFQPNDIIVDVGVNIGFYTLNFAKKAYNGFVHGFEPNPKVLQYANNNISLNKFENIKLNNFGLGDNEATLIMAQLNENLGMNKIVPPDSFDTTFSIEVKVFDDYAESQKLDKIDFIKIDVEGFEMKVLLGCEKSLKKYFPSLIIEIDYENLKANNDTFLEMKKWLEEMGYNIKNPINFENIEMDKVGKHFDILAIHNSKLDFFNSFKSNFFK